MVKQSFHACPSIYLCRIFIYSIYMSIYYGIGFWVLLIIYCLSRQLTAPFFFASAIADIKLNEMRAPLSGAANAYAGLSNTASWHCTAVVAIIKAMADVCSPSRI